MKVVNVEFVVSAAAPNQWPRDRLPMVAFAGRSNVGKSSLANRMLHRKNVMRVSKTPGRTQLLNFVKVNERFYFVDLPGYGYAKVPGSLRRQWGPMIGRFIEGAPALRAVVHIMDIRHKPSRDDRDLLDWLEEKGVPTIPVLTKADKLSANQTAKNLRMIAQELDLPTDAFTVFSAVSGKGKDDLWARITAAMEAEARE
jgi:GTP-binding protein